MHNVVLQEKLYHEFVVVVDLLFYVHGKHLRSCWDSRCCCCIVVLRPR